MIKGLIFWLKSFKNLFLFTYLSSLDSGKKIILGFIFLCILGQFLPQEIINFNKAFIVILGIFIFSLWNKNFFSTGILIGFIFIVFINNNHLNSRFNKELMQNDDVFEIKITSLIKDNFYGKSFYADIKSKNFSGRAKLNWYKKNLNLKQGQIYQVKLKLKPPFATQNPISFNYERTLVGKKVLATGYIKNNYPYKIIEDNQSIREFFKSKIEKSIENLPSKNLILALIFGHKKISFEQKKIMQKTGTSHLLAISGLHIGFIFSLFYFLSVFFIKFIKIVPLNFSRYFSFFIAFGIAFFYGYLAGFSLPTKRALLMLATFFILKILLKQKEKLSYIIYMLGVLLLFFPFSVYETGFYLSFLVVIFIASLVIVLKGNVKKNGIKNLIKKIFLISKQQFYICFFASILSAYFFNYFSFIAPLANLIAIPLVGLIILPILFFGFFTSIFLSSFSDYFFWLGDFFLSKLSLFLEILANFNFAGIFTYHLDFMSFILLFSFLAILLLNKKNNFILLSTLFVFIIFSSKNSSNNLKVTFLDVGQAQAILVEKRGKVLLYDTGNLSSSGFSHAKAIITPLLKSRGYKKIDYLIVSHQDRDHSGGLLALLQDWKIDNLITNMAITGENKSFCCAKQKWQMADLKILALHPFGLTTDVKNDDSCVLYITDKKNNLLLTGDISIYGEREMVSFLKREKFIFKDIDLLSLAHHGSKTSTSESFLDYFKPKIAVASNALFNQFNMTSKNVIKKLKKYNVELFETKYTGAVEFTFLKNSIKIKKERQSKFVPWYVYNQAY